MLKWCNNCKEYSMVIKVYTRLKDNKRSRVMFCLNKGCGERAELPFSDTLGVEKLARR